MNQNYLSIHIEGDFIDSFIYSGTLFLVNSDSAISTYDWESLISESIKNQNMNSGVYNFLRDCRDAIDPAIISDEIIYIHNSLLEKYKISCIQLDGWPTDINIYANRFYVASEEGVKELKYNWTSKIIESSESFDIWKKYAYKVSPNDGHRLAIATGENGIITACPRGGYITESEDLTFLLEIDAHDCEWIGRNLIANSNEGVFISIFKDLPIIPKGKVPNEFWGIYNSIKRESPETHQVLCDANSIIEYSWLAGERLLSLTSAGDLLIEKVNYDDSTDKGDELSLIKEQGIIPLDNDELKVLSAKSAQFGAVVELNNELITISECGIEHVSANPVSWRVFSRAKSYINHLHVVEDDQLVIRAYFTPDELSNKYGINVDDIV